NAVVGRLGDLVTAADKSAGIAPASASSDPQTPALADFARARNAVADDMAQVLRSGGMSDDDIRAWKDALDSSASADELKAAVGRGIDLVTRVLPICKRDTPAAPRRRPNCSRPNRRRRWTGCGNGPRPAEDRDSHAQTRGPLPRSCCPA